MANVVLDDVVIQARMMSIHYNMMYVGQGDASVVQSIQTGQQNLTSVNDMDSESSVLENGVNGDIPPGSEVTNMEEEKSGQNGAVAVEDLADGDVPAASNMEE